VVAQEFSDLERLVGAHQPDSPCCCTAPHAVAWGEQPRIKETAPTDGLLQEAVRDAIAATLDRFLPQLRRIPGPGTRELRWHNTLNSASTQA